MSRHVFTQEERSRGGRTCAERYDMSERGKEGFWATVTKHRWTKNGKLGRVMEVKYPNGPKWKHQ